MSFLKFIFTHSVFIAFCALAMVTQSYIVFKIPINFTISWLVFFATLATYNVYWMVSRWRFSNKNNPFRYKPYAYNVILFVLSAIAVLICVNHNPLVIPLLVVAGILTILYFLPLFFDSVFQKWENKGIVKTILLSFTWTFVTVILPLLKIQSIHFTELLLFFSVRFIFIWILCVIFDTRDYQMDQLHGLHTIATDFSKKSLNRMMIVLFLVYHILLYYASYLFINEMQFFVLLTTGVLGFLLYLLSAQKKTYYFYYFLVDGLMLFSGVVSYIASI